MDIWEAFLKLAQSTGFQQLEPGQLGMMGVGGLLIYLGIAKKFEPLLLVCIGFGTLIINLPMAQEILLRPPHGEEPGGLFWYISKGVEWEIFPPLIFMGLGALTDFSPLIANPWTFLLGAAAQIGIFATYFLARAVLGFTPAESGSIAIIGGADGPTSIYTCILLSPEILPAVAVSAYSYMALVPMIQPPIMKLLTTKRERSIVMKELRPVSRTERILFPLLILVLVVLFVPASTPLVGMLMLGNLLRETGVTERLSKAAQNEIINAVTIFLATSVGMMMTAERFLTWKTIGIFALGMAAFCVATAGGVLMGKLMCLVTRGRINPLIGAAGVSAVPMAARVAQTVGQQENEDNFLLMHAMGPNVAGVIGSAAAAGVLITVLSS
jgi:oxaloacetate decarboxylase beta subunit